MVFSTMQDLENNTNILKAKQTMRAITSASANRSLPMETPMQSHHQDVNRNQEIGYFSDFSLGQDEPLEINMRNLENLTLLDNLNSVNGLSGIENNENIALFQDYENQCNQFLSDSDDSKEPNVCKTVRVPTSEHVAEIVGRQGCKIKDLRARTNTYIKTPMRTESPVFVVTGKETAVNLVISEINSAADHFTQIRASRNNQKLNAGTEVVKPVTREGDVVLYVTVPYRVVGLVVGLKGQTIKQIQQDTDTFIVTPNRDKAPIFEIRGQPSNVERARVMIERHIEVRTRNCRLQDATNLPNSEESRFNSNEYHYSYSESVSPPNGPNSNTIQQNNYINNVNSFNNSLHSPNYNTNTSSQQSNTQSSNFNSWHSYSGLLDPVSSSQPTSIQTWSNATSDYPSNHNGMSSTQSMRNVHHSTNMSVGSLSSNSNGSVSASPPQDFMGSGSFSSRQMGGMMNGSSRLDIVESNNNNNINRDMSSFSNFPMFSTSANTQPKSSLGLSNLMNQNNHCNTSSVLTQRDMNIGQIGPNNNHITNDILSFNQTAGDIYGGQFSGDHVFGQIGSSENNGFPSGESSPTSKSCSLSESSGSQGSPTPRLCKVCEESDVVAALVPCGHNHFCMECADTIVKNTTDAEKKCPICNSLVSDVLRILA